MEEGASAFSDLSDLEFFVIVLQNPSDKLRLPDKFAKLLDGREPRELKLREAGDGHHSLWDVEVVFDGDGHMHLGRGWEQFSRAHGVQLGHFLVFSYDGDGALAVKVFDESMCRRHYHPDDDDDASSRLETIKEEPGSESNGDIGGKKSVESGSINSVDSGSNGVSEEQMGIDDDAPSSQFNIMLRKCHMGVKQNQYLNVPVEFQIVHGYRERREVVLRMRGKSWTVKLKQRLADGAPRASFRYGWHQFCVDNRLAVGDVCFFRALHGGGEDHVLKVEVRRRDGTFAD